MRLRSYIVHFVALAWLSPAPVVAQPSFTQSFFVAPSGEGEWELEVDCAEAFADPLNRSGQYQQKASAELAEVVTECTQEVASASLSQECELAMANATVDYIFLVEAEQEGDERFFRAEGVSALHAANLRALGFRHLRMAQ